MTLFFCPQEDPLSTPSTPAYCSQLGVILIKIIILSFKTRHEAESGIFRASIEEANKIGENFGPNRNVAHTRASNS